MMARMQNPAPKNMWLFWAIRLEIVTFSLARFFNALCTLALMNAAAFLPLLFPPRPWRLCLLLLMVLWLCCWDVGTFPPSLLRPCWWLLSLPRFLLLLLLLFPFLCFREVCRCEDEDDAAEDRVSAWCCCCPAAFLPTLPVISSFNFLYRRGRDSNWLRPVPRFCGRIPPQNVWERERNGVFKLDYKVAPQQHKFCSQKWVLIAELSFV